MSCISVSKLHILFTWALYCMWCSQRDADTKVCVRVLESTEWEGVMALLQFYQMECRWSIRQLLLRALSAMCALHATPRAIMLSSVLPMELARYLNICWLKIKWGLHSLKLKMSVILLLILLSCDIKNLTYRYHIEPCWTWSTILVNL